MPGTIKPHPPARTVALGNVDFGEIIDHNYFYIDKTTFIQEWWENGDKVTLITRPRRFGKTLTMSMVEQFFSIQYANHEDLFKNLAIWKKKEWQKLQGSYPVINLSFAEIKEADCSSSISKICRLLTELYRRNAFLLENNYLLEEEKEEYHSFCRNVPEQLAQGAIKKITEYFFRYYQKKTIILLDEYDTPMQKAYVQGYWEPFTDFVGGLFRSTFKDNPYLERAILTGITRVSKESVFSGLNNLEVITTTSNEYAASFGFTEQEVASSLEEYGLSDRQEEVKRWYDGFVFGTCRHMYNPWSILNFLKKKGKVESYWSNTSSNDLIGKLVQESNSDIKTLFETLIQGGSIQTSLDEQVVYSQLDENEHAIWSLLLASGYLKAEQYREQEVNGEREYTLALTNCEILATFKQIIKGWFRNGQKAYNDFIKALLSEDINAMNRYMNQVALASFSYFDTGKKPSEEPERFYHGFVLGLIVELEDTYFITSNRESGFGRYDVMLEAKNRKNAVIMEFKVHDSKEEHTLQDTVDNALNQIEQKCYAASLVAKGFKPEQIRKYGFAFEGKQVLIGTASNVE